jgi:hypothetical protein
VGPQAWFEFELVLDGTNLTSGPSKLALLASVTVLIAGCGGGGTRTVTAVSTPTTTTAVRLRPSPAPTRCTDYLYDHAAIVTFSSRTVDVTSACDSWIKVNAGQGQYWVRLANGAQQAFPHGLKRICTLEIHNGQITAAVDDNSREVFGQASCSALISAGWVQQHAARRAKKAQTK